MGILNFFSKVSKPWQVAVSVPNAGTQLSEPSDRYDAIGCLIAVWERGLKAHEARYCGKAINQREFCDLIADAVILMSLLRLSDEKGWTMEQILNHLPPDDPSTKAAMMRANQDVAAKLGLDDFEAFKLVLQRLGKGLVVIFEQQTP